MIDSKQKVRYTNKLPEGNWYWEMDFDLTKDELYIFLHAGDVEDVVDSVDGDYSVDIAYAADGLPIVLGVTIRNKNKVSILRDWIEDAIEISLDNLNAVAGDDFGDNYWKPPMVNTTPDGKI